MGIRDCFKTWNIPNIYHWLTTVASSNGKYFVSLFSALSPLCCYLPCAPCVREVRVGVECKRQYIMICVDSISCCHNQSSITSSQFDRAEDMMIIIPRWDEEWIDLSSIPSECKGKRIRTCVLLELKWK